MFVPTAAVNCSSVRAGRKQLTRPASMLDAVSEKAFLAHDSHLRERTADAAQKKFFAQTGQRGRFGTSENIRRDGELELIDQGFLEQRAEQGRARCPRDRSDTVFAAQQL